MWRRRTGCPSRRPAALGAALLCGWIAGCGADGENATGASAEGEQGSNSVERGFDEFTVRAIVGNDLPFVDVGNEKVPDLMFEKGITAEAFSCEQEATQLAREKSVMATRRIEFARITDSPSVFDMFKTSDSEAPPQLHITETQLRVVDTKELDIAVEPKLIKGSALTIDDKAVEFTLQYDCRGPGEFTVEMEFKVIIGDLASGQSGTLAGPGATTKNVCMRWIKVCATGWNSLKISHEGVLAYAGGEWQDTWKELMQEGTYEIKSELQLSSFGVERLRKPVITSSRTLLKVDLKGFLHQTQTIEVGKNPLNFSASYKCEADGIADVTLLLEKDVLQDSHKPEQLELKWKKHCGITHYKYLQVYSRSKTFKNKTELVYGGVVLPGFKRPCTTSRGSSEDADCEQGEPALVVPAKDRRTTLELRISREGADRPPSFLPPPDLSYDRTLMEVTISQMPPRAPASSKQRYQSTWNFMQTMSIQYTCFKEGNSTVMLTLNVQAHKSIDLAWQKQCTEPKITVGKALTAPHAMLIAFIVCGTIGLVFCLIYCICGKEDKDEYVYDDVAKGGNWDLELSSATEWRGPKPDRLGAPARSGGEDEVVYH